MADDEKSSNFGVLSDTPILGCRNWIRLPMKYQGMNIQQYQIFWCQNLGTMGKDPAFHVPNISQGDVQFHPGYPHNQHKLGIPTVAASDSLATSTWAWSIPGASPDCCMWDITKAIKPTVFAAFSNGSSTSEQVQDQAKLMLVASSHS